MLSDLSMTTSLASDRVLIEIQINWNPKLMPSAIPFY
jgi:hypothetical protein